jgi:NADPH-dependent ferric siderophore reductase
VTPHVVRVTLAGPELAGFEPKAPAQHIKVFLPRPGEKTPPLPVAGPDGPMFAEDQPRPLSRTYTPRRFDAESLELDVDFVLHGDGPGAIWAAQAQAGDTAVIAGPGGGYQRPPSLDWLVIAGDDTALPAISTLLATLPASTRASLYLEVSDAAEEQPLTSEAQIDVTWLHRGNAEGANPTLEAALRDVAIPEGPGQVWVACEAAAVRRIRSHFLQERGVDRTQLYTRGYWQLGEANHTDHDYGEDA